VGSNVRDTRGSDERLTLEERRLNARERVLIEGAVELKAEGNALHANEEFEGARDCYMRAQMRLVDCGSPVRVR